MKSKSMKVIKGKKLPHICTGTLTGDLREGFPFNIMTVEHNEDFPMHGHEYSELNIVVGGSAVHVTNYEDYLIDEGDVFVINGANEHGFIKCDNLQLAIIQFAPKELDRHLDELNKLMGFHGLFDIETRSPLKTTYRQRFRLFPSELRQCKNIFASLVKEFDDRYPGYKPLIRGLFLQMVCYLSRYYEKINANEDRFAVSMANVVSHICKNYRMSIRIEALAEISGLSVSQMQRRFKLIYSTTPIKMMNHLRTEEAIRLLEGSKMDLNEIAEYIGYSAASFFSTQFKQLRGMTPREFRQRYQSEQKLKEMNNSSS
jgi:AraC-like DNA-binding protein/mannose-6-phosphate isomerase-like protein (cupin superfamily)